MAKILNLRSYMEDKVCKDIQSLLFEAFLKTTCSNGPYPDPNTHQKVYDEFDKLFKKIVNKKIKI